MKIVIKLYLTALVLLFGCGDIEKRGVVTFSKSTLSTGRGPMSKEYKAGRWNYVINGNDKSILWKVVELDSGTVKLIVPETFQVKNIPKAILFALDSISSSRFSITKSHLNSTKSLEQYVNQSQQYLFNDPNLHYVRDTYVSDFYQYKQDSIAFGFVAQQGAYEQLGFYFLYKKTNDAIIDYTFCYPIEENSNWYQTIFWEMIYSIRGNDEVEFTEGNTKFISE